MDSELVTTKLESLARCVDRIRAKTPPDLETLRHDVDTQDILAVNLERAVQICLDIALHTIARRTSWPVPESMAEAFRILEAQGLLRSQVADALVSAVGFRNLSVHAYDKIDWDIVWSIVTRRLDVFPAFARQIQDLFGGGG